MKTKIIRYRLMKELHDAGMSLREIGAVFSTSYTNVKTILDRGEPKVPEINVDSIYEA